MKKQSLISLFLITFFVISSCTKLEELLKTNLSGDWIGDGYVCTSTTNPRQQIRITHNLQTGEVIATKITGDACVTAGNITFRGTYDGLKEGFDVIFTTGSSSFPNSSAQSAYITVTNSKRLESGTLIFTK